MTPEVQQWQEPRHAEPEPPGGAGRGHGRGRGDQRRSRWRPGPASPPPPAPATARHQQEQVRPQDAAGPVTRKCFTFHSKIFDAKTKNIFCDSISPFVCHFLLTCNKNLQICLKVATFFRLVCSTGRISAIQSLNETKPFYISPILEYTHDKMFLFIPKVYIDRETKIIVP